MTFSIGDVTAIVAVLFAIWLGYLRAKKLQNQIDQMPVNQEIAAAAKNVEAANQNVQASLSFVENCRSEVARLLQEAAQTKIDYDKQLADLGIQLQTEIKARRDDNERNARVIADLSIRNNMNEQIIREMSDRNASMERRLTETIARNAELEREIQELQKINNEKK